MRSSLEATRCERLLGLAEQRPVNQTPPLGVFSQQSVCTPAADFGPRFIRDLTKEPSSDFADVLPTTTGHQCVLWHRSCFQVIKDVVVGRAAVASAWSSCRSDAIIAHLILCSAFYSCQLVATQRVDVQCRVGLAKRFL
jgi:hypothetical protein